MKVLFLYLKAFSFTGGIERFNRCFLKTLHELSVDGVFDADARSAYDRTTDEKYFPRLRFKGFGAKKIFFVLSAIPILWRYDFVILGHLNLAVFAWFVRKVYPRTKIVLIAHGIEVWGKQQGLKRKALESADLILSVSNFTKRKIIENNPTVRAGKIKIIFNAIDPYFKPPKAFHKPGYLLDRYKLRADNQIVLTVTRLSSTEKYKGYDNVIRCVRQIAEVNPEIRYLLCGNADKPESERINALINDINANRLVTTTGFVSDVELVDHYLLADVFVMQSAKEGFGIVFIEALACGRKVIAGNSDGSVDALLNGTLGTLINPLSTEELNDAITDSLKAASNPHELQSKAIENFGFLSFKRRVKKLLVEDLNE